MNLINGMYLFLKGFAYPKLVLGSFFNAYVISKFIILNKTDKMEEFLLLYVMITLLNVAFMFFDLFTGIAASKKLKKEFVTADGVGKTLNKIMGVFMFFALGYIIVLISHCNNIAIIIVMGVMLLSTCREFISIGENILTRRGKKPYIFSLVDKIFNIFEMEFLTMIKSKLKKKA